MSDSTPLPPSLTATKADSYTQPVPPKLFTPPKYVTLSDRYKLAQTKLLAELSEDKRQIIVKSLSDNGKIGNSSIENDFVKKVAELAESTLPIE